MYAAITGSGEDSGKDSGLISRFYLIPSRAATLSPFAGRQSVLETFRRTFPRMFGRGNAALLEAIDRKPPRR
jgi:hypothetical protein